MLVNTGPIWRNRASVRSNAASGEPQVFQSLGVRFLAGRCGPGRRVHRLLSFRGGAIGRLIDFQPHCQRPHPVHAPLFLPYRKRLQGRMSCRVWR